MYTVTVEALRGKQTYTNVSKVEMEQGVLRMLFDSPLQQQISLRPKNDDVIVIEREA